MLSGCKKRSVGRMLHAVSGTLVYKLKREPHMGKKTNGLAR